FCSCHLKLKFYFASRIRSASLIIVPRMTASRLPSGDHAKSKILSSLKLVNCFAGDLPLIEIDQRFALSFLESMKASDFPSGVKRTVCVSAFAVDGRSTDAPAAPSSNLTTRKVG